jgi:hypothetical protein
MHTSTQLKNCCLNFINENIKELESSGELWKLNPTLMSEVIAFREQYWAADDAKKDTSDTK